MKMIVETAISAITPLPAIMIMIMIVIAIMIMIVETAISAITPLPEPVSCSRLRGFRVTQL